VLKITFTNGGLKVNEKCQVIDTREIPIEGLYAIGEMSGGVFYHNYPSERHRAREGGDRRKDSGCRAGFWKVAAYIS
jgi:predicted oxidoreductase